MMLKALNILSIALFSTLTAIGSFIRIPLPFSPVPITVQTLFTYMSGTILGGCSGTLSQIIYILMGLSGLPVFAGGNAGFSVLIGPTGGYLAGFVAGTFVIGKLTETKENPSLLWLLICMLIGTTIIYGLGVIQLMNWMRIDLYKAVIIGVTPYIAGDLLKMLVAAYVTHRIRKTLPFWSGGAMRASIDRRKQ